MQATAIFFIYQARESSMVPAGFLIAQFLQKHLLRLCFDGTIRVGVVCIACMDQSKSGDKFILFPSKILYTFHFLTKSNVKKLTPFPPIKKAL